MWRSVSLWLLGRMISSPAEVVAVSILMGTATGRSLLRIVAGESLRYTTTVGTRIGVEILHPKLKPVYAPAAVTTAAAVAIIGGGQLTSRLGGSGTTGGVSPSSWGTDEMYSHSSDPRFGMVKTILKHHPSIPLIFR